jgi:hypothetical protein
MLIKEKELTRARDALAAQFVVYRFFYEPDVDGWPDKGRGG